MTKYSEDDKLYLNLKDRFLKCVFDAFEKKINFQFFDFFKNYMLNVQKICIRNSSFG